VSNHITTTSRQFHPKYGIERNRGNAQNPFKKKQTDMATTCNSHFTYFTNERFGTDDVELEFILNCDKQ